MGWRVRHGRRVHFRGLPALCKPRIHRLGPSFAFSNVRLSEYRDIDHARAMKYIEVSAGVRYWEDATINGADDLAGTLTPFRICDRWCPVIRLADGAIIDWPVGMEARIHFKVCDDGDYWLLNEHRQRVAKWGGCYVPDDFLCPGTTGSGDYIILKVGSDGRIQNWRQPDIQWSSECAEDDEDATWKRLAPVGQNSTGQTTSI